MTTSYPDAEARRRTVLVAVLNNVDDLRRAASEGWYRIPQRRAPRRIGADYLALYQTGSFKGTPEAQTVTYFAATRRYRLLTRRELLPHEADHPRAEDFYFRIDIGPLQRLESPIPSSTMRRVTFIHTTLECLFHAKDVRELFLHEDPFERLWQTLRENRLRPLKNRIVNDQPMDITLRARGGNLGITCREDSIEDGLAEGFQYHPLPERWELLWLPASKIRQDMDGCLRTIGAALINLGGSVLNRQ